jgi:hypothetical protein
MRSEAKTAIEYLSSLPEERIEPMDKLYKVITKNLPKGFSEGMGYGMLSWSVPHTLYPAGYHCDPAQPLPFLGIASQKNFIALYHMGIYSDPTLLKWFTDEFPKHSKRKLDMGKSCIRFKNMTDIPYTLIGQLVSKITPKQWIDMYEKALKK